MLKITFRQLEIFIAIAKAQNISVAATAIHLSQSALSMALTALEHQLGGKLFDRAGKRLVLNATGKALLPEAINIVHQVKVLEGSLIAEGRELQGNLDIGASTTVGNYLLPALVVEFMKQYPHTQVTLKVSNTAHIIQDVVKFNLDLGVIEGSCNHPEITVMPWKKDHLVIVAAPQHPLAKKRRISVADLHQAKWIMREAGSGTREIFKRAFNTDIHSFLELGHTEAIKNAVATGIGISCLSQLAVAQSVKNKHLVILKTPFLKLTREFFIISHKKKYQTKIIDAFIKLCKKGS